MTDTLKPCPIDDGHEVYPALSLCSDNRRTWVRCKECNVYIPFDVWQSLPRNEQPKPRPRTKEELLDLHVRTKGDYFNKTMAIITAAREDIAAMMRRKGESGGWLSPFDMADEIERMP